MWVEEFLFRPLAAVIAADIMVFVACETAALTASRGDAEFGPPASVCGGSPASQTSLSQVRLPKKIAFRSGLLTGRDKPVRYVTQLAAAIDCGRF